MNLDEGTLRRVYGKPDAVLLCGKGCTVARIWQLPNALVVSIPPQRMTWSYVEARGGAPDGAWTVDDADVVRFGSVVDVITGVEDFAPHGSYELTCNHARHGWKWPGQMFIDYAGSVTGEVVLDVPA